MPVPLVAGRMAVNNRKRTETERNVGHTTLNQRVQGSKSLCAHQPDQGVKPKSSAGREIEGTIWGTAMGGQGGRGRALPATSHARRTSGHATG